MRSLPCPLAEAAKRWPKRRCIDSLTFLEVDMRVRRIAGALPIKPGERVAFSTHEPLSSLLLLFALFRVGATAIPLSPKHPPASRDAILQTLHPCHFIEQIEEGEPFGDATYTGDAIALYLLTSGTTSEPKLAALTFDNLYYSALPTLDPLHLDEESSWLLSLPLFHVSGLIIPWRTFLAGAHITTSSIESATHLSLVPTQLFRLVRDEIALPKARAILLGGAAIAPTLLQNDLPIFTTYGMTETAATVTLNDRLLPFRELKIEEGEIYVRGKTLFPGYWKREPQEGWFATGDLGEMTSDGKLVVLGRKDLRFTSLGEKIQPEEIERALLECGVEEAIVVPKSDEERGAVPVAFVTCDQELIERLPSLLRERLLPFKVPKYFLPLPEALGLKRSRQALAKSL